MADVAVLLWRTTPRRKGNRRAWCLDILRIRGPIDFYSGPDGNNSISITSALEGNDKRHREHVRVLKQDYGPNLASVIGCAFLVLDPRKSWHDWGRLAAQV